MNKFMEDLFKETQSDGTKKWSWFKIMPTLWFFMGLLPSVLGYLFKTTAVISPQVVEITGIFFGAGLISKGVNVFDRLKNGGTNQ